MERGAYARKPTGVKHATKRIRQILHEEKPQFVLRTDIKSYYRSIKHPDPMQNEKTIKSVQKTYDGSLA